MKKALLIGINYTGTSNALQGCINDVNRMRDMLVNKYGFIQSNITMLTDDTNQVATLLPTRDNILKCIALFISNIQSGDTLVFHYSGHGEQVKDTNNDERDTYDEVMVPLDADTAGVILDDDIFGGMISKIPKDVTMYAFFDCCNSGTVCDLEWNFRYSGNQVSINATMPDNVYTLWQENNNAVPGNIYMFSGCYDYDTSSDVLINSTTYQGAFTYCLIKVLNQMTTPMKIRYLLKYVNIYLRSYRMTQRSQFSCSQIKNFDDMFSP